MRILVYKARGLLGQRWRFRILAANGEIVAQSEGYSRRIDCWETATHRLLGDGHANWAGR